MGVLGSFYNLNPCRKTYLDILATSLGSQVAKKGEIKPPKSKKNQCTSYIITPSQRAVANASSLREVRLDGEVEQALLWMKELFEMMQSM